MNTTSPPSSFIATMPIKLEDNEANNSGTPSLPSSIATMPIKLKDTVNNNNDGTPSPPSSSIATMPIKQEDAVAVTNNESTPSLPSSVATKEDNSDDEIKLMDQMNNGELKEIREKLKTKFKFLLKQLSELQDKLDRLDDLMERNTILGTIPIKLDDAVEAMNTTIPPPSVATMPHELEATAAVAINDGIPFDAKVATSTTSPTSSGSEKRPVQDTSEATSKRARLEENPDSSSLCEDSTEIDESSIERVRCYSYETSDSLREDGHETSHEIPQKGICNSISDLSCEDSDGNEQQCVDNLVDNGVDFSTFNDDYQYDQSSVGDHGPTSPSFGGSRHGSMLNEDEGNMSPCATAGQKNREKGIGSKREENFNQIFNLFAKLVREGTIRHPNLPYNFKFNGRGVGRWYYNQKAKQDEPYMRERVRKFKEIGFPL